MIAGKLDIIYEDNHLLALNKPAGLPTMGVQEASLLTLARQYIKRRYLKPGNVYLGVMSRLDAGTSGVVLLARTSKAAARLTEQFRSRAVEKLYWAIVTGTLVPPTGEWVDWVRKDESRQRMALAGPDDPGAKEARLQYRRLREFDGGTLVEIQLLTGRKHQIRLQFAERGFAVWGERKYAEARHFASGMALHARRLVVEHPVLKTPLELCAPLPPAWRAMGIDG
jgi:23S rRNA pseudouridine1911/1915/1917 synthase